MYLIVPLAIFTISIVAILSIVGRKLFYLRKLNPEILESNYSNAGQQEKSFWAEFSPEIHNFFVKLDFTPYKKAYFAWSEKFLRRLRVLSLKLDSSTHNLLTRIRTSSEAHKQEIIQKQEEEEQKVQNEMAQSDSVIVLSKEEKAAQREQELIMEIAQDPKNAKLYDELGRVYVRLNNFEDAAESFRMALKFEPENEEFKIRLEKAEKKLNLTK